MNMKSELVDARDELLERVALSIYERTLRKLSRKYLWIDIFS